MKRPQEPTLEICSVQCRGGCCRNLCAVITRQEAARLRLLNPRVRVREITDRERHTNLMGVDTDLHLVMEYAGDCVFLTPEATCSIYADRPMACRAFPTRPHARCLVWPRKESAA